MLLIVEDNEDDALLMKRAVKHAGIQTGVQLVQDGQEALDYLQGLHRFNDRSAFPFPAVIFLDLKLPRISGFELLKWIRQNDQTKRLIVIILTSSSHPSEIQKAYDLGANSYVVKPSTFQQLLELCQILKTYWFCFNKIADVYPAAANQ